MGPNFETEARAFAAEFPTPNVRRGIELAEAGVIAWAELHEVFRASLAQGLEAVAA